MNKTINSLMAKVQDSSKRMPSIKSIHTLLEKKGIQHSFSSSQNVVETRFGKNTYVNDRTYGKVGSKLSVDFNGVKVHMDTSDSYYSWNSVSYARDLLRLLDVQYE